MRKFFAISLITVAAIVSGCAFIPSMKDAGSPGMISITENITTLAAIKLSDNEIRRVNAK